MHRFGHIVVKIVTHGLVERHRVFAQQFVVLVVNKIHPSAFLSVCALESILMNHSGRTYLIRVILMAATGFVAFPSENLANINLIGSLSKLYN
jgi:hypothetical protein